LLLPLVVLAVILSEAKDPEALHSPIQLEPFNHYPQPSFVCHHCKDVLFASQPLQEPQWD
jgi:hypothetical protein